MIDNLWFGFWALFITACDGLLFGAFLVWKTEVNTGASSVSCPRCGTPLPLPKFREPLSFRQFWYGGWTCPACGTEVDKEGRELRAGSGPPPRLPETARPGEKDGPALMFRLGRRRPEFWVILCLLVIFLVVVFYHYGGLEAPIAMLISLFIWRRKTRYVPPETGPDKMLGQPANDKESGTKRAQIQR